MNARPLVLQTGYCTELLDLGASSSWILASRRLRDPFLGACNADSGVTFNESSMSDLVRTCIHSKSEGAAIFAAVQYRRTQH